MRTRLTPQQRRKQILDGARKARDTVGLFKFRAADVARICGIEERLVRHYFTMAELRETVQSETPET
jgi:AcrR family transcriptional regulator